MKHFYLSVLFLLLQNIAFSQIEQTQELLDSAKVLFSRERTEENPFKDYGHITSLLERVVKVESANIEARYFLGYSYSRLNASDASGIPSMSTDLLVKSSKQFEYILDQTDKYEGELLILDPRTKIASEWGSMALKYLNVNQPDSARWALRQGKQRGGFTDYILAYNRQLLKAIGKGAILLSSGDNVTMPLLYLQVMEQLRTDVSIVDVNMLASFWYPKYLSEQKIITFDLGDQEIAGLDYRFWQDSTIHIQDFAWEVKPSYFDQMVLRSDLVFLSLLKANKFKRQIYFSQGFVAQGMLSLNDFVDNQIYLNKLLVQAKPISFCKYKRRFKKALKLSNLINWNNLDDPVNLDLIRISLITKAKHLKTINKDRKAKRLHRIHDKLTPTQTYPCSFEEYLAEARAEIFL